MRAVPDVTTTVMASSGAAADALQSAPGPSTSATAPGPQSLRLHWIAASVIQERSSLQPHAVDVLVRDGWSCVGMPS